jgi:4-amino-4-deoxy-L-arabinose transferase-like glycosyltransferase
MTLVLPARPAVRAAARGLAERPGSIVAFFVALAAAAGSILPWAGGRTPPRDFVEGFLWGRSFELGYHKHPPLQAWLAGAIERLGDGAWPLAFLLAQACVAVAIWAVWRLATSLAGREVGAIAAVGSLAGVHYYTSPSATFTPDTLSLPLWALALLFYWRAVGERRPLYWFALGLDVALFAYAKYVGALLLVVLGVLTLATPEGRAALRRPEPWLAILLALALMAPHLWWLASNTGLLAYPLERAPARDLAERLLFPAKLLVAQVLAHAGLAALLAILLWRTPAPADARPDARPLSRFGWAFLLAAGLGPLALMLAANLVAGVEFRHAWATPLFALSATLAVVLLRPRLEPRRLVLAGGAAAALILFQHAAPAVAPLLSSRAEQATYPARAAAAALTERWRALTGRPLRVVAGERWNAGNIAFFSPDRPLFLIDGELSISPWLSPQAIARDGALVVWTGGPEPPPGFVRALGPLAERGVLELPWANRTGRPTLVLNWAIRPPR